MRRVRDRAQSLSGLADAGGVGQLDRDLQIGGGGQDQRHTARGTGSAPTRRFRLVWPAAPCECDALFVRITVLPDGVLWDAFEWRTRPTVTWPAMEFRFGRAAYEAEVARLDVDGGGNPDA